MVTGQKTVCLLSSLHDLYDDRIYWKEALALKKAGYRVVHIGFGAQDEDVVSEHGIRLIRIQRVQPYTNLFLDFIAKRLSANNEYRRMLALALEMKAEVYHLHDLQLLRIARNIKAFPHTPKIIYDVHEPYPVTIADGDYGSATMQAFMKLYARYVHWWELKSASVCDLVIATEENVANKFKKKYPSKPVSIVYNYCNWSVSTFPAVKNKEFDFIYAGGVRRRRGALEMLQAVAQLKLEGIRASLLVVGPVCDKGLEKELLDYAGKRQIIDRVEIRGPVPYKEVMKLYMQSRCGMAIFNRQRVNRLIMPIKLFEYIAFGLPVVASDTGHIGNITGTYGTGICVDPGDIRSIAEAMKRLMHDRALYERQRNNCLTLYRDRFNWQQMEKHLAALYTALLSQ